MFLRMIYDEKLAQAAYLIGCQRTGEAIVIDPERDVDRYEQLAAANSLRIAAVAETHIHADFVSGARELAERGAMVYVSDEGDADWKYHWLDSKIGGGSYRYRLLKDGKTFMVGNIEFTAVHTPGHTPEHLCFMVTDRGGGANKPMGVATGDFVFVGDLGRPDLLESAAGFAGKADPSAHILYGTVRKFMEWPDYLQIWPAHGAGSACGKALGAVPTTTVGYEKMFNPSVLAARTEQGFVNFILDAQPEPPVYFARMKRDNKMGPKVLGGVPKPPEVGIHQLKSIDGMRHAIVDTRPWDAFRAGHVPGALHLPLNRSFSTDGGSLIGEHEPIVIIAEPGQVDEAVRDLMRVGYDSFTGWFNVANMGAYFAAGGAVAQVDERSAADARAMLEREGPLVLDVRRAAEFAEGHIAGATNIAHTRLLSHLGQVPKDRHLLVHCRGGVRSARACSLLMKHGYRCTNLAGGILAWEQAAGGPAGRV
jgi:hydroxyacylglutathione hydrolase